ncbi:MAG: T9SS type A sorting domain-containing protein, partial [Ignavibacteriaceae bacterium]|nr:T9SS type A sorting domain-containing protein [Ignavibacteriaceae bacterium]
PNPFNPSTTIKYQLPEEGNVSLKIFNSLGEEVANLIDNEYRTNGSHSKLYIVNSSLPSGVYFYRLQAGNYVETKKMILLK